MKKLSLLFAALFTATVMNLQAADPVSYLYPEYNTFGDPTSSIKEWKTGSCTNYTVVADVEEEPEDGVIYWGEEGEDSWYVVNGELTLSYPVYCKGQVHLILTDGAKLTVSATMMGYAGIQISNEDYSLTIYGQANQTGQLIATGNDYGAGIGGGLSGSGSNVTINGGEVTATGGEYAAGIGGGQSGSGSNITINGGTVTATGDSFAASIGGGYKASGSNITINGGTITATGGFDAPGIGSGNDGDAASNIFVNPSSILKADDNNPPTTEIAHATIKTDVASLLAGKQYATVETPKATPDMHDFLYFVGLNGNDTVRLNKYANNAQLLANLTATFEYSMDRKTWTECTWGSWGASVAKTALGNVIELAEGDTVFFRAKGTNGKNATMTKASVSRFTFAFGADNQIAAGGNIMSLYDATCAQDTMTNNGFHSLFMNAKQLTSAPKLPATTLASDCYMNMFRGCTSLTQAPELPATTLADYCYTYMFYGCTSLTQAPKLPATTLAEQCYQSMFSGCTSLTQAPELKADKLAFGCYQTMFTGCTSLTQAPKLPATTLADKCYCGMFDGCTSLTQAPELKAETLADDCYSLMFNGCTSLEVDTCTGSCDGVKFEPTTSGDEPTDWNQDMFAGCKGDAKYTAEYGIQLGGHYCIKEYVEPAPAQIVVVYDMQGHGEAIENDTINSGEKVTEPADPWAEGYSFVGWFKESTCKTLFDFSQTITATQDSTMTLYANWAKIAKRARFEEGEEKGFDLDMNISAEITGNAAIVKGPMIFAEGGSITVNAQPGCTMLGFKVGYTGQGALIKLGAQNIRTNTMYPLDSVTTFTLALYAGRPNSPQRMATNIKLEGLILGEILVIYYDPATGVYGRKLNAKGNFGTICLAKKITSMEGVEGLFVPYEQTDTTLICEEVALKDVVAGGSYIFKAKAEADSVTFAYEGESVDRPANNDYMLGWLYRDHILTDKEINSISYFYGFCLLANNQITKPLADSQILRNRAMIDMDYENRGVPKKAEAPARGRLISFGLNDVNTPTGVESATYNLQPATSKLLRNGQLIIIRDGKMFNAQGQEL